MEKGFLVTGKKNECFGCETCVQVCAHAAITTKEDDEGFRYPVVDKDKCVNCGLCFKVCPYENPSQKFDDDKYAFGGYISDPVVREQSTSGGAFSAIVEAWCDENYAIFGAAADGLDVFHTYITDKSKLAIFRKSKYSQSVIGDSYKQVKTLLKEGKKILFSGTPCQIAGLRGYLIKTDVTNLLTIEVICEGVPSPLYLRKFNKWCKQKYNSAIAWIDYRYKDQKKGALQGENVITHKDIKKNGKWDFQVSLIKLFNTSGGIKYIKKDRWFNPFWSIWLNHLMSRPSCYNCPFTTTARGADITLGDLWGVHLYCPELYGKNGGASLIICNTEKGRNVMKATKGHMIGHELDFAATLKYQSPLRKTISYNDQRTEFMEDLKNPKIGFKEINKKWAKRPTLKLLYQKYIWGNRQKVFFWNLTHKSEFK